MSGWLWFALLIFSAPLWYSIGVRAERGRHERERNAAQETAFQRSQRRGTVKLNSVRIRR